MLTKWIHSVKIQHLTLRREVLGASELFGQFSDGLEVLNPLHLLPFWLLRLSNQGRSSEIGGRVRDGPSCLVVVLVRRGGHDLRCGLKFRNNRGLLIQLDFIGCLILYLLRLRHRHLRGRLLVNLRRLGVLRPGRVDLADLPLQVLNLLLVQFAPGALSRGHGRVSSLCLQPLDLLPQQLVLSPQGLLRLLVVLRQNQ